MASEEPLRSQPIFAYTMDLFEGEEGDEATGHDETGRVAFNDNQTVRKKFEQELNETVETVHTLLSDALVPWKEDLARVPPGTLQEYTALMEANDRARRTELLCALWDAAMSDDQRHLMQPFTRVS